MKRLVSIIRLFAILFVIALPTDSVHAYTIDDANGQLNRADFALFNAIRGAPLSQDNCVLADKFLDQADVTIDQILRARTMRNCLTDSLDDLVGLAQRLTNLNRVILRECGLRRSYGNTLDKIRDWENTSRCGADNKQQRCQQYADAAVRAYQINISKKCGFTGRPWSDKHNGHYSWCMGAAEGEANQETQLRKIALDNCALPGKCNRFIGTWQWFNGISVNISGDYRFSSSDNNKGTWSCLANGNIEMRWDRGGYIDTLSIATDGQALSGRNQQGDVVSATKHNAMLYDVQQGAYGGGRLCLTTEEATRVRNDSNTVKFTPVGQSCSK
jgi:hypothetical protein